MRALTEALKVVKVRTGTPRWKDGNDFDLQEEELAEWSRFWVGSCESEHFEFDFDPFGLVLKDGRPALLIYPTTADGWIEHYLQQDERPFGTHVVLDNRSWSWETADLQDATLDGFRELVALGFDDPNVVHRVLLSGRTWQGLKEEIINSLKSARKLHPWLK